jgi:hypothetical protein
MGRVTTFLQNVIARQIDERRIVLWFDPERHYVDLVGELTLPDTHIARYDGSFFALRADVDPLLDGSAPPRLLVYVPLAEDATDDALIELVSLAAVLKPGQAAPQRNTRLSVIARRALHSVLGAEKAEEVARQVEAGKLSLTDVERLDSVEGGSAVLKSIFGTNDPQDVALKFLSDERYDAVLMKRQAVDELAALLARAFGTAFPAAVACAELRERLVRHILTSEFLLTLGQPLPTALASIPLPADEDARDACRALARTWRMRRDLQSSYVKQADQIDAALGLALIPLSLDEARAGETFATVENTLQTAVEIAIKDSANDDLLDLARRRASGFWSEQRPDIQARWTLIQTAGQVLAEAGRVERELKRTPGDAAALLRAYTEGDRPWCLLDTAQRKLEHFWHKFSDLISSSTLETLVARARQRFMDVGDELAQTFVRALSAAKFALPDLPRQRDTYERVVRPALADGKVGYVLVDALRFEMARELQQSFDDEYQRRLTATIGSVPTITEIGMAALMPGAEGDVRLVPTGEGKIGLQIGEAILKDRRSRLDWLKRQVQAPLAITTLEDMLPKPKAALEHELQEARLIVVTSPEIDELAESDNIRLARKVMDDVLADLARLVRKLRELGCKTIIIAADHGYLFGDVLENSMKLDPPGGRTVDLHRRVWVGQGGAASDAVMRANLASFGLRTDLDIAVPWGFAVFRTPGGARAYFHGGLAPQELAVPVLVLQPTSVGRMTPLSAIEWQLTTGTPKIATRFFSVTIDARSTSLFEFDPPRVRIEVRSKGVVVAEPVSATYGLIDGTHEIALRTQTEQPQQLEPNTVTLMITGAAGKTASVHLLDAATGRELRKIDRIDVTLLAF